MHLKHGGRWTLRHVGLDRRFVHRQSWRASFPVRCRASILSELPPWGGGLLGYARGGAAFVHRHFSLSPDFATLEVQVKA
jgi:hypothetical protein